MMRNFFTWLLIAIMLWVSLTSLVYNGLNPEKTQMEVFLHIPRHIILNFK